MTEEPQTYGSLGSRSDRKSYGIRLSPNLVKSLKLLAVKMDKPVNRLLEDAIIDYLKKHHEPIQGETQSSEEDQGERLPYENR